MLIYLDAYVPDAGQSEADLLPAEVRAARQAEAAAHGGVLQPPPPEIFGVSDSALADWVRARLTPHPWATYAELVAAGNAISAAIPRVFIHCTGNPSSTPRLFDASAQKARAAGWQVHELAAGPSGHAHRAA